MAGMMCIKRPMNTVPSRAPSAAAAFSGMR